MPQLPNELILLVAELLQSEGDVSKFSQTNRRVHFLLDPVLYRRNALESAGSALTWAAAHNNERTARSAISAGAKSFDEAIILAAKHGHATVMRLLLSLCDLDIGRLCWTALIIVAACGHDAVIEVLLNSQKVGRFADIVVGWENTPLINVALFNRASATRILLDWGGIPVNAVNRMGRTALAEAARNGHFEVVKTILENGGVDVNVEDVLGKTALYHAASYGHADIVKVLLRSTNIVAVPDDGYYSPLSRAVEEGHAHLVKLFLDSRKVDVNWKDSDGRTALTWAAESGHEAITKILLEVRNIEINVVDNSGKTPLAYAIEEGHTSIVNILQAYQPTVSQT